MHRWIQTRVDFVHYSAIAELASPGSVGGICARCIRARCIWSAGSEDRLAVMLAFGGAASSSMALLMCAFIVTHFNICMTLMLWLDRESDDDDDDDDDDDEHMCMACASVYGNCKQ
jgi:hypothetical protein